MTQDKQNTN